jgi:drug/metabolite transporter (DMT)-like permease
LPLLLRLPKAQLKTVIWGLISGATVGLALGTAFVPQLVYTSFAQRIGAARSAVAGSIELPTLFLIGWFAPGEVIGPAQWLGFVLITVAIPPPARATRNLSTQMVLPHKKSD